MREDNTDLEKNNEQIEENKVEGKARKKQKATLGIRPDDDVETRFKELAAEQDLTQTQLFERIFLKYLRNSKDELKLQELDCTVELNSIEGAASVLIKSIKDIVLKAQNQLLSKNNEMNSLQESVEKKIELSTLNLENKVKELEEKNKKLEENISAQNTVISSFDTIRNDIENKNATLINVLDEKDKEIEELKKEIKERDKALKTLEKEIENSVKAINNVEKEVSLLKEENTSLANKNLTLNSNIEMLQSTLTMFNNIKAQEITAIKENESLMSSLKINNIENQYKADVDNLNIKIKSLEEIIKTLEDKNKKIKKISDK